MGLRLLTLLCMIHFCLPARGQMADSICICDILIEGNKHARNSYILRELALSKGQCLSMEEAMFNMKVSEYRLLNTGLFFNSTIRFSDGEEEDCLVIVEVKELFRFGITPTIGLADRNFNVWWTLKENIFDRLNYNLRSTFINVSGKSDKLALVTQWGYSQKLELDYQTPYLNHDQNIGLMVNLLASRQREINYATLQNQQQFRVFEERYLYQRLRARAGISYWPGLFWKYFAVYEWHRNVIDPFVRDSLNPEFFLNGLSQTYDMLDLSLVYDRRDMIPYPESGRYWHLSLKKEGLLRRIDLNSLFLQSIFKEYITLYGRWYTEHLISARVGLQRNVLPYNNIRALGWQENFVRGYEFYMIDGLDFFLLRNSLRYKLIDNDYPLWDWIPFRRYRSLPIKVYLAANSDIGMVNNPFNFENNNFSNRLLYGGGFGIDFVGYYDKVVSLELSINHLGQVGGYLHYKFGIK